MLLSYYCVLWAYHTGMKWLVSKGQDGVSALGLVVARLTAHGSKPSIGLAWSNTSLSTVQCNQCIPMQQDKKLQNKVQQREQQNTTEYDIICIKHIGLENIYDWKTHEDTLFSHFTFWGRHSAGALQTMETAFCRGKQVAQEPWRQMTADDGRWRQMTADPRISCWRIDTETNSWQVTV